MAYTEVELAEQLLECGKKLLFPPSDAETLLPLLNKAESFLSKVEQSPTPSISAALHPAMKALVAKEILRHSDKDVKLAVTACVSEITRITAPDAPYDDDLMKGIFAMIVESFKGLDDISGHLYSKRLTILETVAKVRSCLVMLDLECDQLILEMFHHFLDTIRENHPEKMFTLMETIMTLVLEESEDISPEIARCLLASVKKVNKDVLPIARSLGEKVIGKCGAKLKPCLMEVIRSSGSRLTDYCRIVASICHENSDMIENNENASGECLVDDGKLSERTVSEELLQGSVKRETQVGSRGVAADKSPKSFRSNGMVQTANHDSLVEPASPSRKSEGRRGTSKSAAASTRMETELVPVSVRTVPSSDHSKKMKGQKLNLESPLPLEDGKSPELKPPTKFDNETPDINRPKRGRPSGLKLHLKKEGGIKSNSEAKPSRLSGKKTERASDDEHQEKQRMQKRKQLKETITSDKDVSGEKDLKIATKADKDQRYSEETPKTTSRTKHGQGEKELISQGAVELNEKLLGASIRVWWPDDKRFYRGVIDSFNPINKKHRVLYADGDVELLRLKNERWEFVQDDVSSDEEEAQDLSSSCVKMPLKKKAKTNSDSKQSKREILSDRSSTSMGRPKGDKPGTGSKRGGDDSEPTGDLKAGSDSPRSGKKSKEKSGGLSSMLQDNSETANELRESVDVKLESPEDVGKSKDGTFKIEDPKDSLPSIGSQSKDETAKSGTESHDIISKTESKPNDETPKLDVSPKPGLNNENLDAVEKSEIKSEENDAPEIPKDSVENSGVDLKNKVSISTETASKSDADGDTVKGNPDLVEDQEGDDSTLKVSSSSPPKAQESSRKRGRGM